MLPNSWGGPPGPRVRYGRASPEKADEGVGLRSRGTAPRFILDTAAAYLSGIGRSACPTRMQCLVEEGGTDAFVCLTPYAYFPTSTNGAQ
jgi:hypothetical protein